MILESVLKRLTRTPEVRREYIPSYPIANLTLFAKLSNTLMSSWWKDHFVWEKCKFEALPKPLNDVINIVFLGCE